MLRNFNQFKQFFIDDKIKTSSKFFDEVISGFSFLFHTSENPYDRQILKIPNKLKIIIVDQFNEYIKMRRINKKYFILTFSNIILIIDQNDFSLYQDFFINEKDSTIFCIKDGIQKEIEQLVSQKDPNISLHFSQPAELQNLLNEIEDCIIFNMKDMKELDILHILNKNILAYVIRRSYITSSIDRLKNSSDLFKIAAKGEDSIDNYIYLRHLNSGSLSTVNLSMNINNGQLFALKKRYIISEGKKLFTREKDDYSNISHPFLLRYFGSIIEKDQESLILEFVDGGTLNEIDISKLNDNIKLNLIFSIMIVIQYLHFNNYIYRDLHPQNLMIDRNNSIVLIDLDRMVKNSIENTGTDSTHDFAHAYSAPEIQDQDDVVITEKADIYSLGCMINFILKGQRSKSPELHTIYQQCVEKKPENRPSISKVISTFISKVYLKSIQKVPTNETEKNLLKLLEYNLTFSENINDPDALFTIGLIYSEGICIDQDYEKAIEILNQAVTQNHSDSIFLLGKIYEDHFKDMKTAYELFQKSAELGNSYGQYEMGVYYLKHEYNIKRSIHYFTLSSNQNNPSSQYLLGQIYIISNDVPRDIPKGINLYEKAAKQNIPGAQYNLGVIYFEGKYVKRDSEKAIQYLTAASNQNFANAQYYLGLIYYEGKNFLRNVDKSIHFAELAAKQNKMEAQRLLGQIYLSKIPAFDVSFEGNIQLKFDSRYSLDVNRDDIDKSVHYFSMAARQNDIKSMHILTLIFELVNTDSRHNKKHNYYESLIEYYNVHHYFKFNKELIEYKGQIYGQNINEVINYLTDLSDLNDPQAKYALAFIYLDDVYIERNIEKAIQYFIESADQGFLKAQLELSSIYMKKDIEKCIHYLFKAANQNDYNAQYRLFEIYTNGKYHQPDLEKVDEILDLIENQANMKSLIKFACICYEGKLIKKNIKRTIKFLEILKNHGCVDASIQLGIFYFDGIDVKQNFKKAFQYFSNNNNSYGKFYIGLMYFEGKGVKQNYLKSLHYFIQSAHQNNKYALFYIALFLLDGIYIKKDVNKALFYLSKFKDINSFSSYIYSTILIDGNYNIHDSKYGIQNLLNSLIYNNDQVYLKLGLIYTEGKLIDRCINSSIHFFGQFITKPLFCHQVSHIYYEFKNKYSHHNLMKYIIHENPFLFNNINDNNLYEMLFSKVNNNNNKLGIFYYFLFEASKNNPFAQFVIGSVYYEGNFYIKKDIKKSIQFYYYSAIQGNKNSLLALGIIFSDGKYIERDIEKSIKFLSGINFSVFSESLFILGSIYYEGKYVNKNLDIAINYYRDASNLNDFYAKNNLGIIFRNGIHVARNKQQSIEYFQESIKINKSDNIAFYNLAHLYFFEYKIDDFDKLFKLLIPLVNKYLFCAFELLCLIVYKTFGFSKKERISFEKKIGKYDIKPRNTLANDVFDYINRVISDSNLYENLYEKIKNIQLTYTYYNGCVFPIIENDRIRKELFNENIFLFNEKQNLNRDFYNGFGCE